MPLIQDANSDYIRGVLYGKDQGICNFLITCLSIQYVKSDSVKLVQVPYFNSITTKEIHDFASKKLNKSEYSPTYKTHHLLKIEFSFEI